MFGQQQRLRRLAAQVLLMWLFALATGVVNACVLEPELRQASIASGEHDEHPGAQQRPHAHAAGLLGHDHSSPHGNKAPCAKFCDEPSASTQPIKQQTDTFNEVWLAIGPTPLFVAPSASEPGSTFRPEPGLWRATIPIPIASCA